MNYVILKDFPSYEIWESSKIVRRKHRTKNGTHLKRKVVVQTKAKNGYKTVNLRDKEGSLMRFYVHRLIWMAFNGEIPKGMEIDHVSTDRGDNKLQNLRMVSHSENCRNPKSLDKYYKSNGIDKGKYDYDRLM